MIHALLVDDDADLRTLMAGYLQQYGMRVTVLADGASLRRTLPTGQPGAPTRSMCCCST
jgi:two-component system OmpR family response regulator